jgi:putative flippase GtrA
MQAARLLLFEFGRFGLVGILRTLLGIGLLYLLPNVLGIDYVLSNVIVYTIGLVIGFVLHRTLAFRSARVWRREIIPYLASFAIGYAVNLIVLLLLSKVAGINTYAAQILAMAAFTIVNYIANKLWTFRSDKKPG